MKKIFGPFYPLPLQSAVNHAERFCTLLEGYELSPPSTDERFLAWLSGRVGEVAKVAENAIADWNGGGQSADASGTRIEQYLRTLHEALVAHDVVNDRTGVPECCVAQYSSTLQATPYEAATVSAERTPVGDSEPRRSGTVVESVDEALIEHLLSENEPKAV